MDKKAEGGKAQGDGMDELVRKACALEGCNKGVPCFGGSVKGLCVEGIARYNELRKRELEEEIGVEETIARTEETHERTALRQRLYDLGGE